MASKKYDDNGDLIEVPEDIEKARKAAFEEIQKRAILIDIKRRQFSNMPFDQNITEEACKKLGINTDQLQVKKMLIKPEYLSTIRNIMNDAVLLVVNHTRPWENVGPRVLPMKFYDDFTEAFGQCVDEFEAEREKLINNWDMYVKEAKKNLGPAFNKKDYPTKDQLRQIFHLSIETSEFPNIEDIRLGLGGSELMEMKQEAAELYTDANHSAFESALEGARKATDPEIVDKFVTIAEILNVENSPELDMRLDELREELKETLSKVIKEEESMMVMDDIDTLDCDLEPENDIPVDYKSFPTVADIKDEEEDVDYDNLI